MGQRMPPQQQQPQQAPPGQPDQQQGQSKIGDLVNMVGKGLQLLIEAFTSGGAPKEAVSLLNQSLESFTSALQAASGGQGGPSTQAEAGQNQEQAQGQKQARPMNPAMMG